MTVATSVHPTSKDSSNSWTLLKLSTGRETLQWELGRLRRAIADAEVVGGPKARQNLLDSEAGVYAGTVAAAVRRRTQILENGFAILTQCTKC